MLLPSAKNNSLVAMKQQQSTLQFASNFSQQISAVFFQHLKANSSFFIQYD